MTVVGFNYKKITAERKKSASGKLRIANNVSIKDVKKAELNIGSGAEAMKVDFEYSSIYEPDFGSIIITGDLIFLGKNVKEMLSQWEKSKRLPENVMVEIINNVLQKCNIEGIILSREIGLPPPVQLPKASVKKEEAAEAKKEPVKANTAKDAKPKK